MNCSNSKCKKEIRNYYTCSKCGKNFCTNTCMTEHTLEYHTNVSVAQGRSIPHRNSGTRSVFMKMGKYLKEIVDDPFYNFHNFELVKSKSGKLDQLGSGALGDVYLAKHIKDGKLYVIKQMNKERVIEQGATLEVIYREISVHRRLIHENIVRLYSHFEDEHCFYLVMDYSNKGTLFNLIKKTKGMDEKTAFKYFIQAVSAVNFLHENHLVHRDLKPENMLLDDSDVFRLCDFGWCVDISEGQRITFCGTYEYMAPEVIKEVPYDFSIDVWSLGILLYELIHGYSPFRSQNDEVEDDDHEEIFKNIIKYNFKIEKEISKNCENLITRLLTPENKNRIRTNDVFQHPWVVEFEKEYKREKIEKMQREELERKDNEKNLNGSSSSNYLNNLNNKFVDNLLNNNDKEIKDTQVIKLESKVLDKIKIFDNFKKKSEIPVMIQSDKKESGFNLLDSAYFSEGISNSNKIEKKKDSITKNMNMNTDLDSEINFKKNSITISSTKIIKKDSNSNIYNNIEIYDSGNKKNSIENNNPVKKMNSFSKEINKSEMNDFSILSNPQDNLFDKVLNQVKNKNKDKKKKKSISNNKTFDNEVSLNDTRDEMNISKIKRQDSKSKNHFDLNKFLDEEINNTNLNEINLNKNNLSQLQDKDIFDEEYANIRKKELSKYNLRENALIEEEVVMTTVDTNKTKSNEFNLINKEEYKVQNSRINKMICDYDNDDPSDLNANKNENKRDLTRE